MQSIDLRLYVVTDRGQAGERGVGPIVRAAIEGGATVVQLREKQCDTRDFVRYARELVEICRPARVPLLINDRVDVALAAGADGVHLGQADMSLADARRLLGPSAIVGVSVRHGDEVLAAERDGANYLAANGVWATATKTDLGSPLEWEGLRALVEASTIPMIAIGGIDERTAPLIREAGCAGIAVVSAVMKAEDPRRACMGLRHAFEYATP
ncbi:MAG TPA: thiamine phosphate synthase [Polyangiaceae bacterium]|jgi:thiamine-phosphate pyrophosphorylase|nr:MAG: Thiamine-phosphate synthase [Deltaproteobacteria bacterium ADurb.Bin207]HNS99342.1 thiamine phosphate synthase [Polyangiaceae bacterium]HNZ24149.1 thiamine phosphate synthase [Polyangiaceae bacterium]HOD23814.1 thiamine phosphate synthase [Polyangiaceae bacterium]HOE48759.1 thiamine phosphate synthase [Polyangiaceae bacterium]